MIKEISIPKLKEPVFIAAWPGMGEVAYRSALFLREVLGFKMFAKLDSSKFFKPAAVIVENGVISMPKTPSGIFYYLKRKGMPEVILFMGEAQPPLEYAEIMSSEIIRFVKKYNAKRVFTFAAKPESIDHKSAPRVWISATHEDVIKEFLGYKTQTLKDGQISGLNGILLGVAKKRKMKGICLLGEIPFYTVQIENSKTCIAVLQVMEKYLNVKFDLSPLKERSKVIEEEIDRLINYIKGDEMAEQAPSPLSENDIDKIKKDLAAYTKLPQSAREKIEVLFSAAKKDISQANVLKAELDRWHVYKEYEDRFLDLFKRGDHAH
ncbi:MAG: PAC2 family protein [Candidatus Omnitrophica bacterium]|nr:PAC2 family protein [Candidatus Omnitrophota bacterium]